MLQASVCYLWQMRQQNQLLAPGKAGGFMPAQSLQGGAGERWDRMPRTSSVLEQRHEAEVHVQLLMAME